MQEVKTIGSKKCAKAYATTVQTSDYFNITVNNVAIHLIKDAFLNKINELLIRIGNENLENFDINGQVKGGGKILQVYAVRQAIAKGIVSFYGKSIDEEKKQEIKNKLLTFDKFTLVADLRRAEPKKYGGPSARSRYTKSYR